MPPRRGVAGCGQAMVGSQRGKGGTSEQTNKSQAESQLQSQSQLQLQCVCVEGATVMRSKYLRNGAKTEMHIRCVRERERERERVTQTAGASGKAKKINLSALRNKTMGNEIKNYN